MKERILALISYLGISNREFEIKCGMCNGYINSMRKGLGLPKIENVLKAYPNVNREWLVHGEGTMLRLDATASTEEEEIAKKTDMYKAMMEELARLKKELEDKDKFIDKLNERIDMQDNVIKRLLSDSAITPSKCNG